MLQSLSIRVRVLVMNTDNEFNELAKASFTKINDEVYCTLIEIGIDPAQAYQISFVDIPFDEEAELEAYPVLNLSEDVDDVIFADL